MTDCERIEPFYAHTIAPAVTAIVVPIVILAWCYTISPSFVYVLAPFYLGTTFLLPWLVARLGGDDVTTSADGRVETPDHHAGIAVERRERSSRPETPCPRSRRRTGFIVRKGRG